MEDHIDPGWRRFAPQTRSEMEAEIQAEIGSETCPQIQTLIYVKWMAREIVVMKTNLFHLETDVIRARLALTRARWLLGVVSTLVGLLWLLGAGDRIQEMMPWYRPH